MDRFDLRRLTDFDFERICKDILETELGLQLEIFAAGADGGVDLRHMAPSAGGALIVQCKHWHASGRAKLIKHLETSESKKVARLAPSRYILATSVDLTVHAKSAIYQALAPYVGTTGDIWGAAELEASLNSHEAIVRRHLRLWLSSAAVLDTMLTKDIRLRSESLAQEIDDTLLRFAPSGALDDAQQILSTHNVCVISGIPGIGKTTLAQVLAAQYMATGYELVEISRDIDEALRVWDDNQPQFFYYDDFLGQTSLRDTTATNEDSRLLRFIRMVERSETKFFVMTTREYILAHARQASEKLNAATFNVSKYVLDLGSYSIIARAEVLYNHVYFSRLPEANRASFADPATYQPIIRHPNFNPRLIALTLDSPESVAEEPASTVRRIQENLRDPSAIWHHIFQFQLTDDEIALAEVVYLSRGEIEITELARRWAAYSGSTASGNIGRELRRALASLEGTLLRVDKPDAKRLVVRLHNPSVRDYMRSRLADDRSLVSASIMRITDLDQLETLWATAVGHGGGAILESIKLNTSLFSARFVDLLQGHNVSTWTSDWPRRISTYLDMTNALQNKSVIEAVERLLASQRPEYVESPSDFPAMFHAIRSSAFESVRAQEDSLLEWAIADLTADLYDWNWAMQVSEILSEIGGDRALAQREVVEAELDERAQYEAERFLESGDYRVGLDEAAEMLERLDAYVGAEEAFAGFRELRAHVQAGQAERQDHPYRPPVSRPGNSASGEAESVAIAAMMATLRPPASN